MSLELEVQTGFAVGCKQEEGEEQPGGAELGNSFNMALRVGGRVSV